MSAPCIVPAPVGLRPGGRSGRAEGSGRSRTVVGRVLLAALVLGGCGGGSDTRSPRPHVAPTEAGACNDLPLVNGDPGVVAGFDWSGEKHSYRDAVTIYVCLDPKGGGDVSLAPLPTGAAAEPVLQSISPTGNGVLPFRLRVRPGVSGVLQLHRRIAGEKVDPELQGPKIVTDRNGWHLISHR